MNPTQQFIPALENGDRLSRTEFERRYHLMPEDKKSELIEGQVYIASPLRYNRHGKPHSKMIAWLEVYAAFTPGVDVADNTTVRLDLDNIAILAAVVEDDGGPQPLSQPPLRLRSGQASTSSGQASTLR